MTRPRSFAALYVLTFALLLAAASWIVAADDAAGELSLVAIRPLVDRLLGPGGLLVAGASRIIPISGLALGIALVMAAAVRFRRHGNGSAGFVLSCGLLVGGQTAFVERSHAAGTALYVLGGLVAIVAALGANRTSNVRSTISTAERSPFRSADLGWLLAVTAVAVFFRFYALNHVLDYFEGEISPYSAAATDLTGMLYANAGYRGPWAPLGYLYYLPIFVTTKLFGTSVVAIRLASALASVATIPLLYGFVRRIATREAAIVAAFLVALDPLQIGWGRSDIHPHGSTVQVAILLCWALYDAFSTGRWLSCVAVGLLMGLSCHQYPSGQVAVAIPIVFFVWAFVFARGRDVHLGRLAVSSAVGLGLWVASFPLQYWLALGVWRSPSLFTVFGARTSWSVVESSSSAGIVAGVAVRAFTNLVDLLEGLFTSVPYLFHQCFIPPYPGVPPRTVVWLVMPFVVVETLRTLVRRGPVGSVILALWALVGLVPAVLSAEGYPKRASITYPALMALGAIGMTGVLREISSLGGRLLRTSIGVATGIAALAYVAAASHQWFSGRIYPYGEPSEVAIARSVESMLLPGTLVVGNYWNHYYEGKFAYLLMDALRKREVRPSAYHVFGRPAVPLEQILRDPGVVVRTLDETIWYRWTALWNDLPAIRARERWSHVLFLFQRESWGEGHIPIRDRLERVKQLCPGGKTVVLDDPRVDRRFTLFRCRLSRRFTSGRGASH